MEQLPFEMELDQKVSILLDKMRHIGSMAMDIDALMKFTGLELKAEWDILNDAHEEGLINYIPEQNGITTLYALSHKGRQMFNNHKDYIEYKQFKANKIKREKLELENLITNKTLVITNQKINKLMLLAVVIQAIAVSSQLLLQSLPYIKHLLSYLWKILFYIQH